MRIGVPGEIKDGEYRVAVVPSGVRVLVESGHTVYVEKGAGEGSAIADGDYEAAGATLLETASEVWRKADLIVKVKEPQPGEYTYMRDGLMIFTFLHLAAVPRLAKQLLRCGVTAIGYETVETEDGKLPILTPMSEIAGKLSVHIGANYLLKTGGGEGLLIGGVSGTEKGRVLVLGAGTVGMNAARVALSLGARVTVVNTNLDRMRYIDEIFQGRIETLFSNRENIEARLPETDLLIGAVHRAGAKTPVIVTRDMVAAMKKGSVVVDVSVDQGGCIETSYPTSHSSPVYDVDGVIHYGVANMPGIVPRTSTYALTNATLPFVKEIADLGLKDATLRDQALARGVNIHRGRVTHEALARSLGIDFHPLSF